METTFSVEFYHGDILIDAYDMDGTRSEVLTMAKNYQFRNRYLRKCKLIVRKSSEIAPKFPASNAQKRDWSIDAPVKP